MTAYDAASIHGHSDVCEELEAHGYQSLVPPTEVCHAHPNPHPLNNCHAHTTHAGHEEGGGTLLQGPHAEFSGHGKHTHLS